MNSSQIQLFVVIPFVGCDICHRESFYPPGIWDGSWDKTKIPPVLNLQRTEVYPSDPRPVFHVAGCTTESEAEDMALACGWKSVTLHASVVLVCPKCQTLLAELWERGK